MSLPLSSIDIDYAKIEYAFDLIHLCSCCIWIYHCTALDLQYTTTLYFISARWLRASILPFRSRVCIPTLVVRSFWAFFWQKVIFSPPGFGYFILPQNGVAKPNGPAHVMLVLLFNLTLYLLPNREELSQRWSWLRPTYRI